MRESLQLDPKEKIVEFFQDLYTRDLQKRETSSLTVLKESSWKKFLSLGFPDRGNEAFQYYPFGRLQEALLQRNEATPECSQIEELPSVILEESKRSSLVFLDGEFRGDLSSLENLPKQVVILSLEEALDSSYSQFLKHRMQVLLQQEEDPLALLNGALCSSGLFIYVPSKVRIPAPIQLVFMQTDSSLPYIGTRVHLFLGAHSEVQIINSNEGTLKGDTLCNHFFDVSLEEGAMFSCTRSTGQENKTFSFESFRASLKKESVMKSFLATFGSSAMRHDYRVSLLGERADADLSGLAAVGHTNHSHVNVYMDHSAHSCRSNQFFKNALFSQSKASFTGKIHVKRPAQKTEAYQLNKNLLFSDQATIYSKPNLEIFADDVKASHGSTIAQIDEEQMLYLRTRGISSKEATALLTVGFCQELLDKISLKSLRKTLERSYKSFLLEGSEK